MGLYMNRNEHPSVYKNDMAIPEPNQGYFHKDTFSEMIQEQKAVNKQLSDAFQELKRMNNEQNRATSGKWQEINRQLHMLNQRKQAQETFEHQTLEWLQTIEKNNNKLAAILEHDDARKQETATRIDALSQSNREIAARLAAYESTNSSMNEQLGKLAERNEQLSRQLSKQDQTQDNVLDRLENQEALMEKIHRQISEFRSILYERSSHLAEKIEDSCNVTASYVYKWMRKSDEPLTLLMDQRKSGNDRHK
ncbi:hypothetical protein FH966_04290 [Lentibacillus cibarius]|uniref:Uncharacterized protein n=1 Tax=Lentibacillus cibarius TaxID=2583219 RepID=A0A549YGK0_9BACI|nr:hypothetical protein [Lentibacillus cibarius]TRM11005.1 hypothetical protein FH966_04290 [Lentibacillus cibarius]